MGQVAAISLISTYGNFLHLGTYSAFMQKVPYLRGEKNIQLAEDFKNTAFTFSFGLSSIAFIILVIAIPFVDFIFPNLSSDEIEFYQLGFFFLGLGLPLYYVYNFSLATQRFHFDFKNVAIVNIIRQLALFIITLILVFWIENKAIIIGLFISWVIANFYLYQNRYEWFSLKIDRKRLIELFKLGLPLIAVSLFYTFFTSIDTIMILKYVEGTDQLGLYNFPLRLVAFYILGGTAINSVLYQKVLSDYGKNNSKESVYNTLNKGMIVLALMSPLIGFIMEGFYFTMVDNFLFDYKESKLVLEILIPFAIFITLTPIFTTNLITIGKHLYIPIAQISVALFAILANYLLISLGYGINGIALATGTSYLIYFILLLIMSSKINSFSNKKVISDFTKVFSVFLIVLLIKFFSHNFEFSVPKYLVLNFNGLVYLVISIVSYTFFLLFVYLFEKKFNKLKLFKS